MELFLLLLGFLAAGNSQYYINLGPVNSGYGLTVSNLGDGKNIPAVLGGRKCRITDKKANASMLYVNVDEKYKHDEEVYVTIEYFDQLGLIELHYDSGVGSAYRKSLSECTQTNSGEWKTATFTLRQPDFKNRQNGDNDFRIYSKGDLAVSKISISNDPPKGYKPPMDPNVEFAKRKPTQVPAGMDVIQQWQVHEPLDESLLQDSPYEVCKKIGITSLQSYVGWAQLEPEKGKITYETYDPVVAQIKKHNLKWLPFIITGPYIATPKWFREEYGVDAVCLEHNTPIRIQSIWNPHLEDGVKRFLQLFKDHYDSSVIEALNLGISGNWGESLFPAGGGFDMQGVHTHAGWWCGDKYAKEDFRRWLKAKFNDIADLNASWNTKYSSIDEIEPFLPDNSPSRRASVDMGNWYTQSMTDYAELWVKTARDLYPDLPIYLCTGGEGAIELGADFAAQSKMCAKYNAGIRITNMDDNMLSGFAITRMVSSASRLYGGYYTTEPGGDNTPKGIAGRIFDIVSGGGRGVYFKGLIQNPDNATHNAIVFGDFAKYMIPNKPNLPVAVVMSNSAITLNNTVLSQFLNRTAKLRDSLDFEFIDENMIADGLLNNFKALVMLSGDTLEQSSIDKIKDWVESGGIFITCKESFPLKSVEGNPAQWLGELSSERIPLDVKYNEGTFKGIHVNIGSSGDDSLLISPWHGSEGGALAATRNNPDPSYRWTMSESTIALPAPSQKPLVLRILLTVPEANADNAAIYADNIKLADLKANPIRKWIEIAVPNNAVKPTNILELTFKSDTMVPNASDPRELGIQVYAIQLYTKGAKEKELVPADVLSPNVSVDESKIYQMIARKTGSGYTVIWPESWDTYVHFLNTVLHTEKAPWKQIAEPLDCKYDNVLACRVGNSVYYLNNGDSAVTRKDINGKNISIEPRTLISVESIKK